MNDQPIRRDAVVALGAGRTADALRCYVADHPTIAVCASVVVPALETEIAMVRDVIVSFEPLADDACVVRWRPAGGGVFPRFAGTLRTVPSDTASTILRLEGAYDDPASRRADRTDAELGFRLAQATARVMLDTVTIAVAATRGHGASSMSV